MTTITKLTIVYTPARRVLMLEESCFWYVQRPDIPVDRLQSPQFHRISSGCSIQILVLRSKLLSRR